MNIPFARLPLGDSLLETVFAGWVPSQLVLLLLLDVMQLVFWQVGVPLPEPRSHPHIQTWLSIGVGIL